MLGRALETRMHAIIHLDLGGNAIEAGGAVALARGIVCAGGLRTLLLDSNRLGDDGAAALAPAITAGESSSFSW